MFLRFVRQTSISGLKAREGFFGAAYELIAHPDLDEPTADRLNSILAWYRQNLAIPTRFSRSSSKGYYRRDTTQGLSWFKPTATVHLKIAYELTAILKQHGHEIEILKTSRPGYVIYEDDHQIVAEPFAEEFRRLASIR